MQSSQQIREIYKKLPTKIREIIASQELTGIIDDISANNRLDKNQRDLMAKSISDFLMELNTKENTVTVLTNVVPDLMRGEELYKEVESRILNNLDNLYAEIIKNAEAEDIEYENKSKEEESQPRKQSGVGQSFEQIILNQARAMQPARPKDETGGIGNNEYGIMEEKKEPPINLPTGEAPKPVHDYKEGGDPYREPLE